MPNLELGGVTLVNDTSHNAAQTSYLSKLEMESTNQAKRSGYVSPSNKMKHLNSHTMSKQSTIAGRSITNDFYHSDSVRDLSLYLPNIVRNNRTKNSILTQAMEGELLSDQLLNKQMLGQNSSTMLYFRETILQKHFISKHESELSIDQKFLQTMPRIGSNFMMQSGRFNEHQLTPEADRDMNLPDLK